MPCVMTKVRVFGVTSRVTRGQPAGARPYLALSEQGISFQASCLTCINTMTSAICPELIVIQQRCSMPPPFCRLSFEGETAGPLESAIHTADKARNR